MTSKDAAGSPSPQPYGPTQFLWIILEWGKNSDYSWQQWPEPSGDEVSEEELMSLVVRLQLWPLTSAKQLLIQNDWTQQVWS